MNENQSMVKEETARVRFLMLHTKSACFKDPRALGFRLKPTRAHIEHQSIMSFVNGTHFVRGLTSQR